MVVEDGPSFLISYQGMISFSSSLSLPTFLNAAFEAGRVLFGHVLAAARLAAGRHHRPHHQLLPSKPGPRSPHTPSETPPSTSAEIGSDVLRDPAE